MAVSGGDARGLQAPLSIELTHTLHNRAAHCRFMFFCSPLSVSQISLSSSYRRYFFGAPLRVGRASAKVSSVVPHPIVKAAHLGARCRFFDRIPSRNQRVGACYDTVTLFECATLRIQRFSLTIPCITSWAIIRLTDVTKFSPSVLYTRIACPADT